MLLKIAISLSCIFIAIALYWADKKRILNLGKWDSIVTITVGVLGIIVFLIPVGSNNNVSTENNCKVTIRNVLASKELLFPSEKIEVVVLVDNPENHALILNWQATNGTMNPGLRTNSLMSVYTAPSSIVDDTIMVDVFATGCSAVTSSKVIKIISPSIEPSPTTNVLPIGNSIKLDGKWIGKTEQGYDIKFSVENDVVSGIATDFLVYKIKDSALCPESGGLFGGLAYIDNYSFRYVSERSTVQLEVIGKFESSILATGILYAPDQPFAFGGEKECGIFSVKWEAKKNNYHNKKRLTMCAANLGYMPRFLGISGLKVGSIKVALPHPALMPLTQTVSPLVINTS